MHLKRKNTQIYIKVEYFCKICTSKDLEECFDKRSPEEDGVGVVGFRRDGSEDKEAASDNLPADNGGASSMVLGSWRHVLSFNPRASLTFLHLLPPIFPHTQRTTQTYTYTDTDTDINACIGVE